MCFVPAKRRLAASRVVESGSDTLFRHEWLSLVNDAGKEINCGLLVPSGNGAARPYPVVILLGSEARGKHAIDYGFNIRNVIIAAPDYPYAPRNSYTPFQLAAELP